MKILSHRGLWRTPEEKNTLGAVRASLENGFGFESDIRDYMGKLVISHNIADAASPDAEEVFRLLREYQDRYCFAINIKADGLKDMLSEALARWGLTNYFCFDMSVPQMIEYREKGIRFFTRQSEYESCPPVLLEAAAGVWLDAFEDASWLTEELLGQYLSMGKEVCLVSPDLHDRPHGEFWKWLRGLDIPTAGLMLCTDRPDEAEIFFREKISGEDKA